MTRRRWNRLFAAPVALPLISGCNPITRHTTRTESVQVADEPRCKLRGLQ